MHHLRMSTENCILTSTCFNLHLACASHNMQLPEKHPRGSRLLKPQEKSECSHDSVGPWRHEEPSALVELVLSKENTIPSDTFYHQIFLPPSLPPSREPCGEVLTLSNMYIPY